jgi:type IV pilus assembly protein PilO
LKATLSLKATQLPENDQGSPFMAIDLNLKSLNNIPWYGQLGIFSIFGVIIAGLGWYFFISGLSEQIAVKQGQLDGLKVEIQRGQAVEQKHQEFLTQNKQLLSKLSTLKIILPEAKQTDQLLRQVQESAVASNLLIRKFQPLPVSQKDFFSEWPINLEVDGSYHALGAFFDKLSKFSRIVNVSDVKIVESKKSGRTISTTCVATTFVYNEEKDNAEIQKALTAKKK